MSEHREQLDPATAAGQWADDVATLMRGYNEREIDELHAAMVAVVTEAVSQAHNHYGRFEAGEPVALRVDAADDWPLNQAQTDHFVASTGDMIFLGQDGPLATGSVLTDALGRVRDQLCNRLRESGEPHDPER